MVMIMVMVTIMDMDVATVMVIAMHVAMVMGMAMVMAMDMATVGVAHRGELVRDVFSVRTVDGVRIRVRARCLFFTTSSG